MLSKKVVVFLAVLSILFTGYSLEYYNMNGSYYILSVNEDGDSEFQGNIRLTEIKDNSRAYSSKVRYKIEKEERYSKEELEFVEIDGETYASFINDDQNRIYLVVRKTDFAITLENIDDASDVIKIVLDKEYSNFKYEEYYNDIDHMTDDALISRLHDLIDNQKNLGYKGARRAFFSKIDNENGYVTCVYTARSLKTNSIPNSNNMNCEHSWPQSKFGGASKGDKKCDIHHLFPTDSKSNSRRSSYPFGEVRNEKWSKGGSKLGSSKLGSFTVFEPRDDHKGDLARAMFYFSVRYKMSIDAHQENTFRKWAKEDPVSEKEIKRNAMIEEAQGNRNPFIDRPDLIDNIRDF